MAVYGFNLVNFTSDAYMALPVLALGRSYLVLAYRNVYPDVPQLNGTQMALVACEDQTVVTLRPSVDHTGRSAAPTPNESRVSAPVASCLTQI